MVWQQCRRQLLVLYTRASHLVVSGAVSFTKILQATRDPPQQACLSQFACFSGLQSHCLHAQGTSWLAARPSICKCTCRYPVDLGQRATSGNCRMTPIHGAGWEGARNISNRPIGTRNRLLNLDVVQVVAMRVDGARQQGCDRSARV